MGASAPEFSPSAAAVDRAPSNRGGEADAASLDGRAAFERARRHTFWSVASQALYE